MSHFLIINAIIFTIQHLSVLATNGDMTRNMDKTENCINPTQTENFDSLKGGVSKQGKCTWHTIDWSEFISNLRIPISSRWESQQSKLCAYRDYHL